MPKKLDRRGRQIALVIDPPTLTELRWLAARWSEGNCSRTIRMLIREEVARQRGSSVSPSEGMRRVVRGDA